VSGPTRAAISSGDRFIEQPNPHPVVPMPLHIADAFWPGTEAAFRLTKIKTHHTYLLKPFSAERCNCKLHCELRLMSWYLLCLSVSVCVMLVYCDETAEATRFSLESGEMSKHPYCGKCDGEIRRVLSIPGRNLD